MLSRLIVALLAFGLAGCGKPQTPVVTGGVLLCYDLAIPSAVPPDYVPCHRIVGSVDIPENLRGTIDSSFTPRVLHGVQGNAEFRDGQGKIIGATYHFRGSVSSKDYHAALGLLPKDPRVEIEGRNARGERVRISARVEFRRPRESDPFEKLWGTQE
jgi:hypothetical protein